MVNLNYRFKKMSTWCCFQVMDDRWESEIIEYGAINITGFRIVDDDRTLVRDFLKDWIHFDVSKDHPRQSISVSWIKQH